MNTKLINKLIKISHELVHVPNANQRHFSFLLLRNRIVSLGWNDAYKTHPMSKLMGSRFSTIHSELSVIKRARIAVNKLKFCTLVNVRVNSHGLVLNSKPCVSCQRLLANFEIEDVWFSTEKGFYALS